jgi:putrescine aminotransferase
VTHPAAAAWARHVNPTFVQLLGVYGYGRVFVRARGVRMWDAEGRGYLDALAGFGAMNLGHSHPRLLRRLAAHLEAEAVALNHVGPAPEAAALAERLAGLVGGDLSVVMFSSSGAEAVEAALKLAHLVTGRTGLVGCVNGYHGTNLGTLALMGSARMRAPFSAWLPPERSVPFGDTAALKQALAKRDVAAFVVEPILGEGGVLAGPPGWLREAQVLCREAGALFVLDEVQTGLGRTGADFAFRALGVEPDVLCLAKSLGGGLVPVAATLCRPEHHRKAYGRMDRFDLQSSTYGGNALGMVVADEVLDVLRDEGLAANAAARGTELVESLRRGLSGHPLVKEVRGYGLLCAIELGPTGAGLVQRLVPGMVGGVSRQVLGQWAALKLLEAGVVAQPASQRWEVLRLEPPLTIDAADTALLAERVIGVVSSLDADPGTLREVAGRVWSQWSAGWSFR